MSTFQRRFVAQAEADPAGYRDYVRAKLGVEPETAEALLGVHRHLHHGGRVENQHLALLKAAYPQVAQQIPGIVDQLNAQPAGPLRSRYYLALLAGDRSALEDRLDLAGSDYRDLDRLSTTFHEESVAAELNRRRDAATAHADKADGRSSDIQRWPVDRLSARDIIRNMVEPAGIRDAAAAIERFEPVALDATRTLLADRAESALERLRPDADTSLRGSIEAAHVWHTTDAAAVDLGMLPEGDA